MSEISRNGEYGRAMVRAAGVQMRRYQDEREAYVLDAERDALRGVTCIAPLEINPPGCGRQGCQAPCIWCVTYSEGPKDMSPDGGFARTMSEWFDVHR